VSHAPVAEVGTAPKTVVVMEVVGGTTVRALIPSAPYIKPAVTGGDDEVGVIQDTVVVVKVTSAKVLVTLFPVSISCRHIEVF